MNHEQYLSFLFTRYLERFRAQARILRKYLPHLTAAEAQKAIARMRGWNSWHHLQTTLKNAANVRFDALGRLVGGGYQAIGREPEDAKFYLSTFWARKGHWLTAEQAEVINEGADQLKSALTVKVMPAFARDLSARVHGLENAVEASRRLRDYPVYSEQAAAPGSLPPTIELSGANLRNLVASYPYFINLDMRRDFGPCFADFINLAGDEDVLTIQLDKNAPANWAGCSGIVARDIETVKNLCERALYGPLTWEPLEGGRLLASWR